MIHRRHIGQPPGRQAVDPGQPRLDPEILRDRHGGRRIETARRHLDRVAIEEMKRQRRPARRAEMPFRRRSTRNTPGSPRVQAKSVSGTFANAATSSMAGSIMADEAIRPLAAAENARPAGRRCWAAACRTCGSPGWKRLRWSSAMLAVRSDTAARQTSAASSCPLRTSTSWARMTGCRFQATRS